MSDEGRIARKLRSMIEALGFRNVQLEAARGYWRTDSRADVYRWEGSAVRVADGIKFMLCSWETMTACTKGIELSRDAAGSFEVHSLSKQRKTGT